MQTLELNILVNQFLKGDEDAFAELFRILYPRLLNYSKKFISDENTCQDIVQDVFVKLWENRKSVHETNIKSYLFTMVRNHCLNHLKHTHVVEKYTLGSLDALKGEMLYVVDFTGHSDMMVMYEELKKCVADVLDGLPERCREVFLLSRTEKLKNREIAEKLGVSEKAVEKHITKALKSFDNYFVRYYPLILAGQFVFIFEI